jgi:hypothetical protein
MRAHLAAGGMRLSGRKQAAEELYKREPARQQQRLVAIMQMQPVMGAKKVNEKRGRLMAGARDMKVRKALLDQILLNTINLPRQKHGAVQAKQRRNVRSHEHGDKILRRAQTLDQPAPPMNNDCITAMPKR